MRVVSLGSEGCVTGLVKVWFYVSGLVYVSWLAVLGTASPPLSLPLGTEASRCCPALLPLPGMCTNLLVRTKTACCATAQGLAGELTVHVHHSRGGAVLRRGHLGATLLIFALFLVLVLLEEKNGAETESPPCVCICEQAVARGGGAGIFYSASSPWSLQVSRGLSLACI